ncbi:MAG: tRNA-binding protein [Flavobacteriales bacterium]
MEKNLNWSEFDRVNIRVGTILHAQPFPEARKPAYQLHIDFGEEIGVLKSSAQITVHHRPEEIIGKQIVAVVNFPDKQIGPWMSQCLVLGSLASDGSVVLLSPMKEVKNGERIA